MYSVPLGASAILILYFVWPSAKNITDVADSANFRQLDFFGAVLNAIFSICFVICLQEVGTREFQWGSPINIGLLTFAGVAAATLYLWQWYISRGAISQWILPQLPWRIVVHRPMSMAIV